MTHNPRRDRGRSLMANVILLWSDSLLRIKLSESYKAFFKKLPHRILGDFFMIIIIYFYNYYIIIIIIIIIVIIIIISPLDSPYTKPRP